jgi:glycosyltransferase involved in cell wall biosynthesis
MHIIVLSNFPDRKAYGAETSLFRVCERLALRGHDITLLYNRSGDLLPEYKSFCFHVAKIDMLAVYGRIGMLRAVPAALRAIFQLPRARYELVYANQYPYVWVGSILSLFKDIPLVCHHRDGLPPGARSPIWPFLFKRVAMNIFVSESTREGWVNSGLVSRQRSMTVHNGIPEELYSPVGDFAALRKRMGIPANKKVILYAGRLVKRKGIETLFEAFSKILRRGNPAELWLAGGAEDPSYLGVLQNRCVELGIEPNVRFLGFQKNIVPYYQVSDEVVLPSVEDESFGKAVAESMACGTPALASRIGGIPEVLSGSFQRFLFKPGDSSELSHCMQNSLDWRDSEPSLSGRCREHVVRHFSMDKALDGIEKAFGLSKR